MKRNGRRTLPLAVLSAALGALLLPSAAAADERPCRGLIGAQTVDGDIRVPAGATCNLQGTMVKGNVKVKRNATLAAKRVRVDGNVQGENSKRVSVFDNSRIDGDVQVFSGGPVNVRDSVIEGNVQLDSNRGKQLVINNRVGGDVQLFRTGSTPRGSRATGSAATCSARRTGPPRSAVATSSRATRRTSAHACEHWFRRLDASRRGRAGVHHGEKWGTTTDALAFAAAKTGT